MRPKYKTRTMKVEEGERFNLDRSPNIHKSGSVLGMKRLFWGIDAYCIRCGSYIYKVDKATYERAH